MNTYITVSGAYGRDYKSLKAARLDWAANKDFVIRDIVHGSGLYINKRDVKDGEVIMCRYKRDTMIGELK